MTKAIGLQRPDVLGFSGIALKCVKWMHRSFLNLHPLFSKVLYFQVSQIVQVLTLKHKDCRWRASLDARQGESNEERRHCQVCLPNIHLQQSDIESSSWLMSVGRFNGTTNINVLQGAAKHKAGSGADGWRSRHEAAKVTNRVPRNCITFNSWVQGGLLHGYLWLHLLEFYIAFALRCLEWCLLTQLCQRGPW